MSKVIDFVSKDQSRVALTGFLLDTKNNVIVATDSYKLVVQEFDFKNNIELPFVPKYEGQEPQKDNIVLPSKVYDLLKLFKDNETFNIKRTQEQIEFTFDNITIVSRLFSGKFPDYEKLIPDNSNFNYCFKINAKEVVNILDEANKLLDNKDNLPIKIQLDTNQNKVLFSMVSREIGDYNSEVKVEVLKTKIDETENKPLIFAVSPDYLKICLKNITDPTLKIVAELKPIVIQETDDFKVLLMPIRIS
jgi:DNA polymerase-3 subunit beta